MMIILRLLLGPDFPSLGPHVRGAAFPAFIDVLAVSALALAADHYLGESCVSFWKFSHLLNTLISVIYGYWIPYY